MEFRKDIQDDIDNGYFPKAIKEISELSPQLQQENEGINLLTPKQQLIKNEGMPKIEENNEEESIFFNI